MRNPTRRGLLLSAPVIAGFVLAGPASAQGGGTLGLVMMHGKQGSPRKEQGLSDIGAKLPGARAVVPSMPWSDSSWEKISVTPDDVFVMIDGYAAQLRDQGAQRIVVVGQSLGANMALSYAVARQNVAAVVMSAPGHNPQGSYRNNKSIRESIDKAAALVQSGQGDQSFSGGDDNQGNILRISTTARVYLSWMSPRGKASMPAQAPLLPATIPLMMVIGTTDPSFGYAENNIYKPAARNPYSKYLAIEAAHRETAFAASQRIADWIKGLPTQ